MGRSDDAVASVIVIDDDDDDDVRAWLRSAMVNEERGGRIETMAARTTHT